LEVLQVLLLFDVVHQHGDGNSGLDLHVSAGVAELVLNIRQDLHGSVHE
jgi:hypothetical protein